MCYVGLDWQTCIALWGKCLARTASFYRSHDSWSCSYMCCSFFALACLTFTAHPFAHTMRCSWVVACWLSLHCNYAIRGPYFCPHCSWTAAPLCAEQLGKQHAAPPGHWNHAKLLETSSDIGYVIFVQSSYSNSALYLDASLPCSSWVWCLPTQLAL